MTTSIKAIGIQRNAKQQTAQLLPFTTQIPNLLEHDLLVEVKGIGINPIDLKVRNNLGVHSKPKIIGYDASGIVRSVGKGVTLFKVGDEVFYAGDITRPGCYASMQVVDERVVGTKPKSLNFAESAGIPLTSITAWELLFDSLKVSEGYGNGDYLLVVGGAGGVGSILIQLAKKLTQLKVVATASREETSDWVKKMGADKVINHHRPIDEELQKLGISPRYIASLTATDIHLKALVKAAPPRGQLVFIDQPKTLDICAGRQKALGFHWEFMFSRPMFTTPDLIQQHKLLNRVSQLLDAEVLSSTVTSNLGVISSTTIQQAHNEQAKKSMVGKQVLEGFS